MFGSPHHRQAVARSVERSLDLECDLLTPTGDGRGGQTWSAAHTGVGCTLAQTDDETSRQGRGEENRSLYVFLFASGAPVREHHRIRTADRFDNERIFTIRSINPTMRSGGHIIARAQEITD